MPKFVLETLWDAESLASHCNNVEGGCPVIGLADFEEWPLFHCPFAADKDCTEITPADWQALEVKDGVQ